MVEAIFSREVKALTRRDKEYPVARSVIGIDDFHASRKGRGLRGRHRTAAPDVAGAN